MPGVLDLQSMYRREVPYVRRTLRRLGVPEREVQDVLHDVFITVWRRAHTYDAARPLRPWLFGIVFRVASDNMRRARHTRELLTAEGSPEDLPDPLPTPDEALLSQEALAKINSALYCLDLKHRVVLVMHDVTGHKAAEIAHQLAIPVKTVYSRLRNGRERFAVALRDADAEGRARGSDLDRLPTRGHC